MPMEISLIIPAYNEEKQILNTLISVIEYMEETPKSYEIIVVDDGSRDKTAEMVKSLEPYIKLISYRENRGKGYAVAEGVKAAKGEYIFFTDADLSYSPDYITAGEKLLLGGAELVVGRRDNKRSGYPVLRRQISKAYKRAVHHILPLEIEDCQCGFKGFRNSAAKRLFGDLKTKGFSFDTEILCRAQMYDMEIAEMPVIFQHKKDSKVSFSGGLKMVKDLYKIRRELFDGFNKG